MAIQIGNYIIYDPNNNYKWPHQRGFNSCQIDKSIGHIQYQNLKEKIEVYKKFGITPISIEEYNRLTLGPKIICELAKGCFLFQTGHISKNSTEFYKYSKINKKQIYENNKDLIKTITEKKGIVKNNRNYKNRITIHGKTFETHTSVAEYFNIERSTFIRRLKQGMSPENAVKTTKKRNRPHIAYDHLGNKLVGSKQIAEYYGFNESTLRKHIAKGKNFGPSH